MRAMIAITCVAWILGTSSVEAVPRVPFPKPAFDAALKLIVGGAAAYCAAQSAEAYEGWFENARILYDLRRNGLDTADGAIYWLCFQVDPNAAHRWFLDPNVYALVQVEGQGDYVPASIAQKYKGQKYMMSFYAKQVRPGSKILVHLMDDKEFWNTAWNSLLKTKVNMSLGGNAIVNAVQVNVTVNSTIQLIDKNITFQPPVHMAEIEICVPPSGDGTWRTEGRLLTGEGEDVGSLEFAQVWIPKPGLVKIVGMSLWSMVFWGGLACVLVIIFISRFFTPCNGQPEKNAGGIP